VCVQAVCRFVARAQLPSGIPRIISARDLDTIPFLLRPRMYGLPPGCKSLKLGNGTICVIVSYDGGWPQKVCRHLLTFA